MAEAIMYLENLSVRDTKNKKLTTHFLFCDLSCSTNKIINFFALIWLKRLIIEVLGPKYERIQTVIFNTF